MKKYTFEDIEDIELTIRKLKVQRSVISRAIAKERQKIYNHRKYLKRKLEK